MLNINVRPASQFASYNVLLELLDLTINKFTAVRIRQTVNSLLSDFSKAQQGSRHEF